VGRLPFSAHEAAGASAPGIPCALCSRRGNDLQNPGRIVPRERKTAPVPAAFFANINSRQPTWNSLYGCTDPFMLLATRKAEGLGQSSNRNDKGDEEAN